MYHAQGTGKNRTQCITIHYNFIGVLDLPEVEEYPDNVVLDSRQGVAIEYLVGEAANKPVPAVKSAQRRKTEQPYDCSVSQECSVAL